MNHTITLTPKLNVQPNPSPPRLSFTTVMWYKFLQWLEKASASALLKTVCRLAIVAMLATLTFAPSFALGYLTAILQWNSYRIPLFIAVLALTFNGRKLWRLARRGARIRRGANQHTYHGVAVSDMAAFLQETMAFKRDEAIKRLALSQGQYAKIAQELEDKGILVRGEANARILRPIGREHLVRQLRDNFPLIWDPEREIWVERDGMFNQWVLRHEFTSRKLDAEVEKKQRKLERLEERIDEAKGALPSSSLAALFAHSSQ